MAAARASARSAACASASSAMRRSRVVRPRMRVEAVSATMEQLSPAGRGAHDAVLVGPSLFDRLGSSRSARALGRWSVPTSSSGSLNATRPRCAHSSTASAAASRTSSSTRRSSAPKRVRTCLIACSAGSPMPTRSRANFCVPSSPTIERMPLCVPALPCSRMRSLPSGRSKSSYTTSRSSSGAWSRASALRTARPDSFMYVIGLTSTRSRPL